MKKLMSIVISILFALSLSGLCFAAEKAPFASEGSKVEQKKEQKKADKKKAKKSAKKAKKSTKATKEVKKEEPKK